MPPPHGGKLINRVLKGKEREKRLEEALELPKIKLTNEYIKDVENIAHGVFSPLEGPMTQEDYLNVLENMRLSNDLPWTIPIVIDVSEEEIKSVKEGDDITILSLEENKPIVILHIEEIYGYDKEKHAEKVFGVKDPAHPGVAKTYQMKEKLIGGKIDLLDHSENPYYKYTLRPVETRILFKEKGWRTVVGFQTRNAPHIGHEYVQKTALTFTDGLFINPVIGKKKKGDFKDEVILAAYEELIKHYYLKDRAVLAILRTEMRYAGPREAIFHAIVRKNFGCTHFIVGRDHAGVGNFYPPYAAQEIFDEFPDLGIIPIFFKEFFICKKCGGMANEKTCPHPEEYRIRFSGTMIRKLLQQGKKPPKEIMRPEIAEIILKWENPFVE